MRAPSFVITWQIRGKNLHMPHILNTIPSFCRLVRAVAVIIGYKDDYYPSKHPLVTTLIHPPPTYFPLARTEVTGRRAAAVGRSQV